MSSILRNPASARTSMSAPWLRLLLVASFHLGALTLGSSEALAADASGPGVQAIRDKLDSLPAKLRDANFATAFTENPQWTPDGGVYQFFQGSNDIGAVYWSKGTGAHILYGDILAYWADAGYETVLGYPTNDESDDVSVWCPDGTVRSQEFVSRHVVNDDGVLDVSINQLCWDGSEVVEGTQLLS